MGSHQGSFVYKVFTTGYIYVHIELFVVCFTHVSALIFSQLGFLYFFVITRDTNMKHLHLHHITWTPDVFEPKELISIMMFGSWQELLICLDFTLRHSIDTFQGIKRLATISVWENVLLSLSFQKNILCLILFPLNG